MKHSEYKGFECHLDDDGTFYAVKIGTTGERVAKAKTLEALRSRLNELSKQQLGQQVLLARNRYFNDDEPTEWVLATLTGIREEKRRGGVDRYYRVEWNEEGDDRNRRFDTVPLNSLVKATTQNRQRIHLIRELQAKQIDAKKTERELDESLERYTEKDFGLGEGEG